MLTCIGKITISGLEFRFILNLFRTVLANWKTAEEALLQPYVTKVQNLFTLARGDERG